MNTTVKAHAALLGANLFYGAGFTIAKMVMPRLLLPFGFIFLRVGGACILFWLTYCLGAAFRQNIERKHYTRIIACAFFGVAANQLLFFKGLSLTTPIHGSLMMLCTPILVTIFAVLISKEKFSKTNVLGLLLGVCGALLLILSKANTSIGSNTVLGDFFILLNATSYSIYLVLVKPLMQYYRPIIVIRIVFLIGLLLVFPFGVSQFLSISWNNFTSNDFCAVAFIVIGVTFFTYLWNIYALKIVSSSVAGAYIYLQPLFAAIIAVLYFHESVTLQKGIAAVLIFTGVYFVTTKRKKAEV